MKCLQDLSFEEIEELVVSLGQPKFRAGQLYDLQMRHKEYDEATNLPKVLLDALKNEFFATSLKIIERLIGKDGTEKYLYALNDGNVIEGVFMPHRYGNTLCVSTQVGCRMGCKFCASTTNGLIRNLTAGEMLSTIAVVNADNGKCTERNFTNIVLMGSGEPLDNFTNVVKWLELITDKAGFNVSERNISLSTCGLVDKIYDFAKLKFNITLCISLHATTDEIRKTIMPIANAYRIEEIIKALHNYVKENSRRVVFEYCLIKDVNNTEEDITRLKLLTKGLLCHVNVICLNANGGSLKATTKQEALAFVEKLNKAGISATLRRSQGSDIEGACGMLKAKTLKEEN